MTKDPRRALQQLPLLSKGLQGARLVPGGAGTGIQCVVLPVLSIREQQGWGCSSGQQMGTQV